MSCKINDPSVTMPDCPHVPLLRIIQDDSGSISLHYGSRLRTLANGLPRPSTQHPSLLALVGRKGKGDPTRNLYPESRHSNHRRQDVANIVLHPDTTNHDYPLFIADCCPTTVEWHRSASADERCHGISNHPIHWPTTWSSSLKRDDLATWVHARLLLLFVDVLCIFGADCDGLPGVAAKLASWAAAGSASKLPQKTLPRVVVVTRVDEDVFETQVSLYTSELLAIPRFSESFSSLNVVNISGISRAQLAPLRRTLEREAEVARLNRLETRTLFSATRMAAFFESALRSFSQCPDAKFDFVKSSREYNPVAQEFRTHLRAFLRLSIEHHVPRVVTLSYVASTILLDSFAPDMHCR
jgi:hypothetical protein